MPYASQQDLIDRYSEQELLDRTDVTGAGTIDAAVVAAALADADAVIDLHLRARYRVPLSAPIPKEIVQIACALSRHTLWKDQVSEAVEDGRDQAIANLEKIAAGKIVLDAPAPETESRGVFYVSEPPPFTPSTLKEFTG